ncbi:MAG: hypothetical protein K0R46_437 [Herbinix sp.]|jgi:hypothetical protein|nr:hypothetical protein [Herbinix sp.]
MVRLIKILMAIFLAFFVIIGLVLIANDFANVAAGKKVYIDHGLQTFHTSEFSTEESTRVTGRKHNRGTTKEITYYAKYLSEDGAYSFEKEIEEVDYELQATTQMRVLVSEATPERYRVIGAEQKAEDYSEEDYNNSLLKTIGGFVIMAISLTAILLLLKKSR